MGITGHFVDVGKMAFVGHEKIMTQSLRLFFAITPFLWLANVLIMLPGGIYWDIIELILYAPFMGICHKLWEQEKI